MPVEAYYSYPLGLFHVIKKKDPIDITAMQAPLCPNASLAMTYTE